MSARREPELRSAGESAAFAPAARERSRRAAPLCLAALLALVLTACLVRKEMGVEPSPSDAGCVAECADAGASDADALHDQLQRLLEELSHGPWTGEMASGNLRVAVTFEFRADGTYTVRCEADTCQVFFPSLVRGVLHGRYEISAEVLHGAFFGAFEDPFRGLVLRSELSFLILQGDHLTFERRLLTRSLLDTDFIALLARADLTRSP